MKTKNISYMLLSSLFIINGCGSSSTSNNNSSEEAVYMTPLETNTSDTSYKMNTITSGSRNSYKVTNNILLEDAEDGTTDGWRSYDSTPSPVTISNIYDNSKKSKVIDLKGVGLKNGSYFSLGNDSSSKTIKWSMNFNGDYTLYVRLNTKYGLRYIYYTSANYNYGKSPIPYDYYIHHGLGSNSKSGTWKTFSRDLTQDLKEFEPNNNIKSIDGLYIRGSGRIDDITLLKTSIDSECIGYQALINKINNNEDVTHANTSCITDMSGIFNRNKTFNQDISAWDMSNVTSTAWMFNHASAFNQDISSWNLSNVTNMSGMFNHAYSFNQNINAWDTSRATEMDYTFTHAEAFNQDLSLWQVDNVQSHEAFAYAAAEGVIEPNWDGGNNLLSQIKKALASQINYHDPIKAEDITDLPNGNKLVRIKTGFAHIDTTNPNNFKVTRFDSTYSDISSATFTSVLSKDKSKLYILSVDEQSFVHLQIINLLTLKSEYDLTINGTYNRNGINLIIDSNTKIVLSDDEQQVIIPKENNGYWVNPKDVVIDIQHHIIINNIQKTWLNEKGSLLRLFKDDVLFVNNTTRLVKVSNLSSGKYGAYTTLNFIEYAIFDISTIDSPKILKTIRFEEYHNGMDIEKPIIKLLKNGIVRFNTGRNVYLYDLNTNKILLDFLRLSSPTHYSFIETKDNKKIYFVRYESMEAPRLYRFNLDTLQLKASKDIGYYIPNNPKLSDDETKLIVENIIDEEIELNLNELLTEDKQARYDFPE